MLAWAGRVWEVQYGHDDPRLLDEDTTDPSSEVPVHRPGSNSITQLADCRPGSTESYATGIACMRFRVHVLTLRNLRGQWGGNGDKVALLAAIVNGHLASLAWVIHIAVALGHEQLQRVVPVHEHTWKEEAAVSRSAVWWGGAAGQPCGQPRTLPFLPRASYLEHSSQVSVVVQAFEPSTLEAKAEGLQAGGKSGIHSKMMS